VIYRNTGLTCKILSFVIATAFSTAIAGDNGAGVHTWTDSTGKFTREGSFQRLSGDAVVIKAVDGQEITIPLKKLSPSDQSYAQKRSMESSGDPFHIAEDTPLPPLGAGTGSAGNIRVVVAQGVGVNVEEAKRDAYREAVRQVVGAYVEGDTVAKNDVLIEDKVISLSGGLVQRCDVISQSVEQSGGLYRLKVRAEVRVTDLLSSLNKISVTTVPIRGQDLDAQQTTLADQSESATEALNRDSLWELFPASFFTLRAPSEPKAIESANGSTTLAYKLEIAPDYEQYQKFASRMIAILSRASDSQGEFTNNGRPRDLENRDFIWRHLVNSYAGIASAFPERDRGQLLKELAAISPKANGSGVPPWGVFGFDQFHASNGGNALGKFVFPWRERLRELANEEACVMCIMSDSDKTYTRTRWKWFLIKHSQLLLDRFVSKRYIICDARFLTKSGRQVVEDSFSLGRGFGYYQDDHAPIVFISPFWIGPNSTGYMWYYSGYIARCQFTRFCDVAAEDVPLVSSIQCIVKPSRPSDVR
jgi:hypothetical protein